MQNSMTILSPSERESRQRRSAIMTALCFLAIIAVALFGIWLLVSAGSAIGFYSCAAVGAAVSDPLRRHLSDLM